MDLDLGQPIPALAGAATGSPRQVRALVRLHDRPLLQVDLDTGEEGRSAEEVAGRLWSLAGAAVIDHLREDGLRAVDRIPLAGLQADGPRCQRGRRAALAAAVPISVVVATRDRPQSLADCLRSLVAQEYPDFEVVVVDNDPSTDATFRITRELQAESNRIKYVRESRRGLAAAHNRGLCEVSGALVAFTDDDVLVDRHWLAALAEGFALDANVGCVTGLIVPVELRTPAQIWVEDYGFAKGFRRRMYDLGPNRPDDPLFPFAAGSFGSGANMAFRADVLRAIGGFDAAVGAGTLARGGDDLVSFFQVITGGWTLAYEPSAIVRHRHRDDYASLRRQAYGYGVGLTAFLTRSVWMNPRHLPELIARIPAGLAHARTLRLPTEGASTYPRSLTWIERRGMAAGPFAYAASRLQGRRAPARVVDA